MAPKRNDFPIDTSELARRLGLSPAETRQFRDIFANGTPLEALAAIREMRNQPEPPNRDVTRANPVEFSPEQLRDDWLDIVDYRLRELSYQGLGGREQNRYTVELKKIQPQQAIAAVVKTTHARRSTKVRIEVDFDAHVISEKCQTGRNDSPYLVAVYRELEQQLDDPDSEFNLAVLGKEGVQSFKKQAEEEKERLRLENQNHFFRRLQGRMTGNSEKSIEENLGTAERAIWNLRLEKTYRGYSDFDNELLMKVIVQKEKKSGGWTKGREVQVPTFANGSQR